MATSGLRGPFPLTVAGINNEVTKTSAGAYALGKVDNNGTFEIHYVGRSDDNVANRLLDHVQRWYPEFKYEYYSSGKTAFEKECSLYHDFSPPDNDIHPAKPAGTNHRCSVCAA